MSKIRVITDTDASLPPALAAAHGIVLVPINVHFGDKTFQTGVDINDAQLFERVDREGKLPTTSAPTPGQFAQAYETAFDDGAESVLCFCVSSEISATYKAAETAQELYPNRDITIVDSRTLSMGQGFMALAAAEAIAAGATKEEALATAQAVGDRTYLFGALATLKYLAMSGRVGYLTAGMANLLNIKPVLTVQDGKLELLERVRTKRKAWRRVIDCTIEALAGRPIERAGIIHSSAPEDAQVFEGEVRSVLDISTDIIVTEFTAGLSVHTGIGLVGLTVVAGS
ncbi:MAG: DegV family protein [Anaerolineae bacterium]|nr:DegV family protein [Anaerolineae bacterium]